MPDGVFDERDEDEGGDEGGGACHIVPSPLAGEVRRRRTGGGCSSKKRRPAVPLTIEGELIAKSTGTTSAFAVGERVFHQKFGNGNVTAVDGNKLTIHFDKAGEKRVVDSFVERV